MMIHHFLFGYRYQVRESKDYETPFGPVRWSYVTESVGLPILDPGTTVIELDGRTIFKAKRGFQEASPFAKNLTINGDQIFWEDGDYAFTLSLRKLEPPSRAEINQ
ncbi:MAG: hypothetical protein KDM64_14310 [Verrucomicrobiae bacterium]|nr:hypothetical protein [Verrucomicrobiae bacterium]